jgi:hypothetical protein
VQAGSATPHDRASTPAAVSRVARSRACIAGALARQTLELKRIRDRLRARPDARVVLATLASVSTEQTTAHPATYRWRFPQAQTGSMDTHRTCGVFVSGVPGMLECDRSCCPFRPCDVVSPRRAYAADGLADTGPYQATGGAGEVRVGPCRHDRSRSACLTKWSTSHPSRNSDFGDAARAPGI